LEKVESVYVDVDVDVGIVRLRLKAHYMLLLLLESSTIGIIPFPGSRLKVQIVIVT